MAHRLTTLLLMLMASCLCRAQDALSDPTRPPTAAAAAGGGGSAASGPVLQSVLLGKGRRPLAVISGQRVELGAQYGDAVLTSVSETEVVLQGPGGRQVLKMTPEAAKHPLQKPSKPRRGTNSAHGNEVGP